MRVSNVPGIIGKGIRLIENALVVICGAILMFMMFLGTADVAGRYLVNEPITGTYEISEMLMGALVLLGWAYTQRIGGHVSVELFFNRFPPGMQKIVNLVTNILSLALFIIIAKQSWHIAVEAAVEGRHFLTFSWPTGPFYFLVPVGAFFICLEFIIMISQNVVDIRKK